MDASIYVFAGSNPPFAGGMTQSFVNDAVAVSKRCFRRVQLPTNPDTCPQYYVSVVLAHEDSAHRWHRVEHVRIVPTGRVLIPYRCPTVTEYSSLTRQ